MSALRDWVQTNSVLVTFLGAQAFALATGGAAIVAYTVKMEGRVSILENRGAPYTVDRLNRIDERLTILEQIGRTNGASIDRIVDVLTKELGKNPSGK
jgi:hypothetical protein